MPNAEDEELPKTDENRNGFDHDRASDLEDIKAALNKGCDFTTIRDILKGRTIPDEVRSQVWQILLGVAHKHDPFVEFDDLFDLPEQETIRAACSKIVEKLGNDETDRLSVTSDLESVLTLFCKSREMHFESDNGWSDVLQLLATLRLPKQILSNVFHALVTKYIPLGCVPNGRPFDLFRLLLLYHDPNLCSVLDTRKILPDLYAKHWFNSLFTATCNLEVSLRMWDVYLQQADPFLIFFMALVVLMNARDQLLEMEGKSKEETSEFISSLLSHLQAVDIEDFCQLSLYYSSKTPQSFRRDYHGPLFGSNLTHAFESVTVHSLLCLPVSVQELLKANLGKEDNEVRYFVVDGRPLTQYNNGHLPGAFSLDAALIVNDPTKFHDTIERLNELKTKTQPNAHWCFMGSGRDEEDQYVHMVVAYFLQKGITYVSVARGGYRALHDALKETLSTRLKSHNVKGCVACKEAGQNVKPIIVEEMTVSAADKENSSSLTAKSLNLFNKVKDVVKTKSVEVKGIVTDYVYNHENNSNSPALKHVDSTERHGKKLYRNAASVFSISEGGSSDELSGEEGIVPENDITRREKVRLKDWLKKSDVVDYFDCQEIDENRKTFDSYVVLTKTHLYVLRTCDNYDVDRGYAYVKSRRPLTSILKITSKRNYPELLTFKYGFELTPDKEKITGMEKFFIPKAGECAKSVKLAIVNLIQSNDAPSASTGTDS